MQKKRFPLSFGELRILKYPFPINLCIKYIPPVLLVIFDIIIINVFFFIFSKGNNEKIIKIQIAPIFNLIPPYLKL